MTKKDQNINQRNALYNNVKWIIWATKDINVYFSATILHRSLIPFCEDVTNEHLFYKFILCTPVLQLGYKRLKSVLKGFCIFFLPFIIYLFSFCSFFFSTFIFYNFKELLYGFCHHVYFIIFPFFKQLHYLWMLLSFLECPAMVKWYSKIFR